MIGHQHLQSQLFGIGYLSGRNAAAVHGDQQVAAPFCDRAHRLHVEAVALFKTRRNIVAEPFPFRQMGKDRKHQGRRRDSVGVVVAVHADVGSRFGRG